MPFFAAPSPREPAQAIGKHPEIVEFYSLAGDIDYLLKIIVSSIAEYDRPTRG